MNLQKIPLKTVRQFLTQDVVLADYQDLFTPDTPHVTKKVEDFCYAKVIDLTFFFNLSISMVHHCFYVIGQ